MQIAFNNQDMEKVLNDAMSSITKYQFYLSEDIMRKKWTLKEKKKYYIPNFKNNPKYFLEISSE